MVVPAPTSIGLLKEHAIQELGYSQNLDICNFDYFLAGDKSSSSYSYITGSHTERWPALLILALSSMTVVLLLVAHTYRTRGYYNSKISHSTTSQIQEQVVVDLESQLDLPLPELSHSQSSTPASSPAMGKAFSQEFQIHSYRADNRMKQS